MIASTDSVDAPFVDLYSVLGVAPDAPLADLRRRIALLYTEAQDNLDHRSFRKRFYYHELYEVHLPYSHHVLLDETRRAAYDAERARALQSRAAPPNASTPSKPAVPSVVRPASTSVAPSATSARPAPERAPERITPAHEKPEYHETLARDLNVVHKKRPPAPEWARMDRAVVERRRDNNRRELIKQELQLAGQQAGGATGVFCLALTLVLLFVGSVSKFPLSVLGIICALALVATFFLARTASRGARRNIVATLSKMPYEELMLRTGR